MEKKFTKWRPSSTTENEEGATNTSSNGKDIQSQRPRGNQNTPFPMTGTPYLLIKTDTNFDNKKMKSNLKKNNNKTPHSTITFEDYLDERIRIMQKSTDEYSLFLKQLDDLIAKIDSTMEKMRTPLKNKTVHFSERNEVFLIPSRKTIPQETTLSIDFQTCDSDKSFSDPFY